MSDEKTREVPLTDVMGIAEVSDEVIEKGNFLKYHITSIKIEHGSSHKDGTTSREL